MQAASTLRGWLSAALVTAVVAVAHLATWAWVHRPATPPDWSGEIGGFAFSAFQRDQSPLEFRFPSHAEIEGDIALLARYSPRIRSYASAESDIIPQMAQKYGLDLLAGAWLDRRLDNNQRELDALVSAAERFPSISRAMVGNETILRSDLTPRQLMAYLDEARKRLKVPVSTLAL